MKTTWLKNNVLRLAWLFYNFASPDDFDAAKKKLTLPDVVDDDVSISYILFYFRFNSLRTALLWYKFLYVFKRVRHCIYCLHNDPPVVKFSPFWNCTFVQNTKIVLGNNNIFCLFWLFAGWLKFAVCKSPSYYLDII